jgi:hypothetical protein
MWITDEKTGLFFSLINATIHEQMPWLAPPAYHPHLPPMIHVIGYILMARKIPSEPEERKF